MHTHTTHIHTKGNNTCIHTNNTQMHTTREITHEYTHIQHTHREIEESMCEGPVVEKSWEEWTLPLQYTRVKSRGGYLGTRLKERDCQETGEQLNRLGHPGLGLNYPKGSSQSS